MWIFSWYFNNGWFWIIGCNIQVMVYKLIKYLIEVVQIKWIINWIILSKQIIVNCFWIGLIWFCWCRYVIGISNRNKMKQISISSFLLGFYWIIERIIVGLIVIGIGDLFKGKERKVNQGKVQ